MSLRTSEGVSGSTTINVLIKWTTASLTDIASDMRANKTKPLKRYAEQGLTCKDTSEFREHMGFPPPTEVKLEDCRTPPAP